MLMVTIERKAKFSKSKATYRRRDNRRNCKPIFESPDFNLQFWDGIKRKKATNKIIKNLIKNKIVVNIEYNDSCSAGTGIILGFNKNFIQLVNLTEGIYKLTLEIINFKKLKNIIVVKCPIYNMTREAIKVNCQQFDYFNNTDNELEYFPTEIKDLILQNLNLINLENYLCYNIEDIPEFYNFVKSKNLRIEFYVENYVPVLHSKIINVTDTHLELKVIDLSGIIVTNNILIPYDMIEFISIDAFNIREKKINNIFELKEHPHDNVIKQINERFSFINTFRLDNNREDIISFIIGPNFNYDIDEEFKKIIDFLVYNPDKIKNITNNYDNSKSIITNIIDNFDLSNISKEVNFEPYDYVDLVLSNETIIKGCNILKNMETYLIVSDEDVLFLVFKKHINKFKKTHHFITEKLTDNVIFNLKDFILKDILNEICWIVAKNNVDWCFKIEEINEDHILVRSVHFQGCISSNIIKINLSNIISIQINDTYLKRIKETYLTYHKNSVLLNYQKLYDDIYNNIKDKVINRFGFNHYIDTINILREDKILYFSVHNVDSGECITYYYNMLSNYIIDFESLTYDSD